VTRIPPADDTSSGPTRRATVVALGAPVAGLAALAVASPLLDLFGRNPAYFLTQGYTTTTVILFAVVVGFVVPLVLGALPVLAALLIDRRFGEAVRAGLLGLLGALLGAELLGKSSAAAVVIALGSLAVGIGLVAAHHRWSGCRAALRLLALTPFAFVALFVFASPTTPLLTESGDVAFADVTTDENVVMVVFDELPLAALLDETGQLDAGRFPNLARLAGTSHEFTNVTSPSWTTTEAVPALLTGLAVPEETTLPTVGGFPRNLFTLLGGTRRSVAIEPVTSLCPSEVCDAVVASAPEPTASVSTSASDAAVLLAQMAIPEAWSGFLPDTDHSWGAFLDDEVSIDPVDLVATAPTTIPEGVDGLSRWRDAGMPTGLDQARVLDAFVESLHASDAPSLSVAHVVLPHRPWVVTPQGYVYADREWNPGLTDNVWDSDAAGALGLQRQLLQVQHVDRLIGSLIDRLESEGIWDDTLLVVTADHGAAFVTGEHRREPVDATLGEIFWVPLFVKAPHQTEGVRHDDAGTLVDVLPTIVDLLDVDPGWSFDGTSLLGDRAACASRAARGRETGFELPCDDALLREATARNEPRRAPDPTGVEVGGSVAAQLAFTPDADAVAALGAVDRSTGRLPIALSFSIEVDDPGALDAPLVVTVDRVPAAVVAGPFARGVNEVTVLLDEGTIRDGENTLDLVTG
jgi:hypothetical protein